MLIQNGGTTKRKKRPPYEADGIGFVRGPVAAPSPAPVVAPAPAPARAPRPQAPSAEEPAARPMTAAERREERRQGRRPQRPEPTVTAAVTPATRPPGLAAPMPETVTARPEFVAPRPEFMPPRPEAPGVGRRPQRDITQVPAAPQPAAQTPEELVAQAPAVAEGDAQPLYGLTRGDWEQLVGMPGWRRAWEIASRTQRGIPLQGYEIKAIEGFGWPGRYWSGDWGPEEEWAWQGPGGGGGGGWGGGGGFGGGGGGAAAEAAALPPVPYESVPSWYNKNPTFTGVQPREGDVLWAANAALAFMEPTDQAEIARYLYVATGGNAGPFTGYLGAGDEPFVRPYGIDADAGIANLQQIFGNLRDTNLRGAALSMIDLWRDTLATAGTPRSRAQQITLLDGLRRMREGGPEGWDVLGVLLEKMFVPTSLKPAPGQMVWSSDLGRYVPWYNVQWL